MSNDTSNEAKGLSFAARTGIAAVFAVIGFAAVYVMLAPHDNASEGPGVAHNVPANADPQTSERLNSGEMQAFVYKSKPEAIEAFEFTDKNERPMTLADFKGKVVLLNLWATWCAPCRKEMPDLDRLQGDMGSDNFEVVALSLDRGGINASQKFLDDINIKHLATYVDASSKASKPLRVIGMPTTLLIDKEGRELGRLIGPAKWDSDDAKRLIEAALR